MTVAERLATTNTSCADCCERPCGLRDLTWPGEWYHPKQDPGGSIPILRKRKMLGRDQSVAYFNRKLGVITSQNKWNQCQGVKDMIFNK